MKDIGIICVESGYDIHIAGAAGLHVRATDLLGHVATEEEAIEYVAAIMQLYREQAAYLERVWKWVEQVGLENVRAAIMDDHEGRRRWSSGSRNRSARCARIPWAERAAGRELHEFMPLAVLRHRSCRSPPNERHHETRKRLLVRRRPAACDPAAGRAHA